jgi:hypothetical protein
MIFQRKNKREIKKCIQSFVETVNEEQDDFLEFLSKKEEKEEFIDFD